MRYVDYSGGTSQKAGERNYHGKGKISKAGGAAKKDEEHVRGVFFNNDKTKKKSAVFEHITQKRISRYVGGWKKRGDSVQRVYIGANREKELSPILVHQDHTTRGGEKY